MKLGIFLSAAIGVGISTGSTISLALSILAPVVWLSQQSRAGSFVCAVAYYLAALRELSTVSRNFFGSESGRAEGVTLWIVAGGLLALPWLWAWSPSPIRSLWRCPIALLLSVVPPLGLIGLASPTVAAGLLFPSAGFAGFALTLWLPALILNSNEAGLLALLLFIATYHISPTAPPKPPADWQAVNTHFGPVGHGQADLVREYQIGRRIQLQASRSSARVVIFPEAVAPNWIDALLLADGKTVVVGSVESGAKGSDFQAELAALERRANVSAPANSTTYQNKLLVRGAQNNEFSQRIPIPFGMWKPFTTTGVPLNINGPGTLLVAGRRVAVVICYEQLLVWPILDSMLEDPSLVVAVSNNVWVAETSVPAVKKATMQAWAKLFDMPIFFAANT